MHSIDFHGSNGYILYQEMNLFFAESVEQTPVLNIESPLVQLEDLLQPASEEDKVRKVRFDSFSHISLY